MAKLVSHGLELKGNEGHLAVGAFGALHSDAKFESKQLRSHGIEREPQ